MRVKGLVAQAFMLLSHVFHSSHAILLRRYNKKDISEYRNYPSFHQSLNVLSCKQNQSKSTTFYYCSMQIV